MSFFCFYGWLREKRRARERGRAFFHFFCSLAQNQKPKNLSQKPGSAPSRSPRRASRACGTRRPQPPPPPAPPPPAPAPASKKGKAVAGAAAPKAKAAPKAAPPAKAPKNSKDEKKKPEPAVVVVPAPGKKGAKAPAPAPAVAVAAPAPAPIDSSVVSVASADAGGDEVRPRHGLATAHIQVDDDGNVLRCHTGPDGEERCH